MPIDRSLVAGVVTTHYPAREVTAVEPVESGHRPTAVVRFDAASPLVVQFAEDIETARTEAALVAAIRDRTGVPVPPMLATGTNAGQAYSVSEFRPGTDLHTRFADTAPARRRDIARQFGRFLGELHGAFSFESCGTVSREPGAASAALVASGADCDRWLREYGRRAVERLPPEFDPLRPRLRDCLDGVVATSPPRLFPWDLRPGNALVSDGWLSAVLDWERPLAAPPALAVAKTEYLVADWYVDDPVPLRRAFRDGYEAVRPTPSVRPVHRVVAIADSAVDSRGAVTNPRYPERGREESVAFHRAALRAALPD